MKPRVASTVLTLSLGVTLALSGLRDIPFRSPNTSHLTPDFPTLRAGIEGLEPELAAGLEGEQAGLEQPSVEEILATFPKPDELVTSSGFQFPRPQPWDETTLEGLEVFENGGNPHPSAQEGVVEVRYSREDGTDVVHVTYEVWDLDPLHMSGDLEGLIGEDSFGNRLPDLAQGRRESVQALMDVARRYAPFLRLHYEALTTEDDAPWRRTVWMVPVAFARYHPAGDRHTRRRMKILYEAQIPIERAGNYIFGAEVINGQPAQTGPPSRAIGRSIPLRAQEEYPKLLPAEITPQPFLEAPRRFQRHRIQQRGWLQVLDGRHVATPLPIEAKRISLSNGKVLQLELVSEGSDRTGSWSGNGVGPRISRYAASRELGDAPGEQKGLIDLMVRFGRKRWESGKRVIIAANSGRHVGGLLEEGDLFDLSNFEGHLPPRGVEDRILWDYRVGAGQLRDQWISIGHQDSEEEAVFVVEGSVENLPQMIQEGDQLVESLRSREGNFEGGPIPHYKAWVAFRENGVVRLHIQLSSSDTTSEVGQPKADQEYYLVRLEEGKGLPRLVSKEELEERYGVPHVVFTWVPERDGSGHIVGRAYRIQPGDLVFPMTPDVIASHGAMVSQNRSEYDEPYIRARLDRGMGVVSVPLRHPRVQAIIRWLRDGRPGNQQGELFQEEIKAVRASLGTVEVTEESDDEKAQRLIHLVKQIGDFGLRYQEAFEGLPAEDRNRYTRNFWETLKPYWEDRYTGSDRIRIEVIAQEEVEKQQTDEVVAVAMMPTLDLITEVVEENGQEILKVRLKVGGSPAHIAQALTALGIPTRLVAAVSTRDQEDFRKALQGVSVRFVDGEDVRISIMIPRGGNRREIQLVAPGRQTPLPIDLVERIWAPIPGIITRGPYVVVFGERLPGEPADQEQTAQEIARQTEWLRGSESQKQDVSFRVAAHYGWSSKAARSLLAQAEEIFITTKGLENFSPVSATSWAGEPDGGAWRHNPARIAELAHLFNREFPRRDGVRKRVWVTREAEGLVGVDGWRWMGATPMPLHQFNYASGTDDQMVSTVIAEGLLDQTPDRSAEQAVVEAVAFMGRADRGKPPSAGEGQLKGERGRRWPVLIEQLPIPKKVREDDRNLRDRAWNEADAWFERDRIRRELGSSAGPILGPASQAGLEQQVSASTQTVGHLANALVALWMTRLKVETPYLVVADGIQEAELLLSTRVIPGVRIVALVDSPDEQRALSGRIPDDNIFVYDPQKFSSRQAALDYVWQVAAEWLLVLDGVEVVRVLNINAADLPVQDLVREFERLLPPAWQRADPVTAEEIQTLLDQYQFGA